MRLMTESERVARYSRSSFEASQHFLDSKSYGSRLLAIYQSAAVEQQRERLAKGMKRH
jgi:hypothetical protein